MKELLVQYGTYNCWANQLIIDALLKLNDSDLDKEILSSFPSLRKTVYHTWSAEYVWVQRLQQVQEPVWAAASFEGTFAAAAAAWKATSESLAAWIARRDEAALKAVISYHDLRGNPHSTPVADMLLHVFNHSTYHRGQLVTMMRQARVKEIPGTDFIAFVRTHPQTSLL